MKRRVSRIEKVREDMNEADGCSAMAPIVGYGWVSIYFFGIVQVGGFRDRNRYSSYSFITSFLLLEVSLFPPGVSIELEIEKLEYK
jgi:hypothetical protein